MAPLSGSGSVAAGEIFGAASKICAAERRRGNRPSMTFVERLNGVENGGIRQKIASIFVLEKRENEASAQ